MAKAKRGNATSSSKMADNSDKQAEKFSLMLDSSDDEAPEEVTFEDSKTQALRSMKQALDTARREKELLKEKRRKRQELFQEQKKRKLLPADVLEEIDPTEGALNNNTDLFDLSPSCFSLKGNYTVATLEERSMASFQQQAAEDFIQSRLYGPGSCRTTSNELLSLQNKKGWNKSAAVQFVKKDWGKFSRINHGY
uniref:Nucleolar protein 7 n=1 Tax=Lates calcarifer TaxID=8187 RepID=A0A4W6BN06_LATCA